jgi:hypothetical protein
MKPGAIAAHVALASYPAAHLITEHGAYALVVERPPALVDVTGVLKLGTDGPIAHTLLVQPSRQGDGLRALLGMRFPSLTLADAFADAVTGESLLLCNKAVRPSPAANAAARLPSTFVSR